ncbi:MAG: hypothetical protein ACI83B_003042 [Sediminicola sp.]|jgi:hypothetical protein
MDNLFLNQAANYPLESEGQVKQFITMTSNYTEWKNIGVLTDKNNRNTIFVLLSDNIVAAFRINMPPKEGAEYILKHANVDNEISYRCLQGKSISQEDINSLETINNIWQRANNQNTQVENSNFESLLIRLASPTLIKGRGPNILKPTKEQVYRDAHGRCMFSGCGEDLSFDKLTGTSGNFTYLAHNVASAERGERGIKVASKTLSNEPSNILLLCDKHHRLVDKVAACDYSAEYLSKMREGFCIAVENLLEGLKYHPIPVYAVLWPVNNQVVSSPTHLHIANSLSRIRARMLNAVNIISDNEYYFRTSSNTFWQLMPNAIKQSAEKLIQQTSQKGHHAALFAFGPMPALIGLGALIGNKTNYVPMLRYRDTGEWVWPSEMPAENFYEVRGTEDLKQGKEFVITISLTALVPALLDKAQEIKELNQAQVVDFEAQAEFMGNGAIPHPENGTRFCAVLKQLLNDLKAQYQAETVHLLVCASNAASVFIGQAFDNHHPNIIVYDFVEGGMTPRLVLKNVNSETLVELPSS